MLIAALSGAEAAALITGMLGICAAMVGGTYAVLTKRNSSTPIATPKTDLLGANPVNDKSGDLAAAFWLARFASLERGQMFILAAHAVGLVLGSFALIVDRSLFSALLNIGKRLDNFEDGRRRR